MSPCSASQFPWIFNAFKGSVIVLLYKGGGKGMEIIDR